MALSKKLNKYGIFLFLLFMIFISIYGWYQRKKIIQKGVYTITVIYDKSAGARTGTLYHYRFIYN